MITCARTSSGKYVRIREIKIREYISGMISWKCLASKYNVLYINLLTLHRPRNSDFPQRTVQRSRMR